MNIVNTIFQQWGNGIGEIQFLLALALFFIVNWIGKHSYSAGYTSVTMFVQNESAPAFNFVLRVFSPIVYIIIVSAFLYSLNLDLIVAKFYLVSAYYIFIRLAFNGLQARLKLLNWNRELIYITAIMALSYFAYDKFISVKKNILPDFSNVANELWIIIILFVYKILNELDINNGATDTRKNNYLDARFNEFKAKYGRIVNKELDNDKLRAMAYAIMIHENFNRPPLVRLIENISFRLSGKPHTLGIMQVHSKQFINDKQSVVQGVLKIRKAFESYSTKSIQEELQYFNDYSAMMAIASDYNTGDEYTETVTDLAEKIVSRHYKNSTHTLTHLTCNQGLNPVMNAE